MADWLANSTAGDPVHRFWSSGWGFDRVYDTVLVKPFVWTARTNKDDVVDAWYAGLAATNRLLHLLLSLTQTGNLRWYAMGLAFGAVAFLGIMLYMQ
jgi:NADH-quinone oxidoreductase subunit L